MVKVEKCSVKTCKTTRTEAISLHRVPEANKETWLGFLLKANEGTEWKPTTKMWVCSKHFSKSCIAAGLSGKRYIRDGHSPTLVNGVELEDKNCAACGTHLIGDIWESVANYDMLDGVRSTQTIGTQTKCTAISDLLKLLDRKNGQIRSLLVELNEAKRLTQHYESMYRTTIQKCKPLKRPESRTLKRATSQLNFKCVKKMKTEGVQSNLSFTGSFNNDLILRILNRQGKPQNLPYAEDERRFAYRLHYLSPMAYSSLRKEFNNLLPCYSSFLNWTKPFNSKPGILTDVIAHIACSNANKVMVYSLSFDEIAIRKQVSFCPKNGKITGFVDYAGLSSEKKTGVEAKSALFCLAKEINGLGCYPVAYVLTDGCSTILLKDFMQACLLAVEKTSAIVLNITFDGLKANFKAAEALGANLSITSDNFQPFFVNSSSQKIYVYPDPIHMYKLLRNCFNKVHVFINSNEEKIKWSYIEDVVTLQSRCGLKLANKLSGRHTNFQTQKMKAKLALQVFSSSVASSLDVLRQLNVAEFKDSGATSCFLSLFNTLFDILNSISFGQGPRSPLREKNQHFWLPIIQKAKKVLLSLKMRNKSGEICYVYQSSLNTWVTGLYICLSAIEVMFDDVVLERKLLSYIPLYKLCQDFIELFFGKIRKRYGNNDNPNTVQLEHGVKSIIMFDLDASLNGNCISQENSVSRISPLKTGSGIMGQDEDDAMEELPLIENLGHLELVVDNIVVYISGFVGRALTKKLTCRKCISALLPQDLSNVKIQSDYVLINHKDRGGLFYPSEMLVSICKVAEHIIRRLEGNGITTLTMRKINILVTRECHENGLLTKMASDIRGSPKEEHNHETFLAKSIAQTYSAIRLRHIAKECSLKNNPITKRTFYNKLTHFKGD